MPAAAAAAIRPQGPPLSVPKPKLRAALQCTGDLGATRRTPVLLASATTVSPRENFSWNWQPALSARGTPWCTVFTPNHNMSDIQVAGEYYVHAVRSMHRQAGRRISILGHSQGGVAPRWALRFWPDTRRRVDDVIGFGGSNHGTAVFNLLCATGCAPALWQQTQGSQFMAALNAPRETFTGISYTEIYTHYDEIIFPNLDESGSSSLHGGGGEITNVAIQDVCPLAPTEHLGIGTFDPIAYALAIDALRYPGPAEPQRIGTDACGQLLMPGVDELSFATDVLAAATVLGVQNVTYPHLSAEPPLACYADPGCGKSGRR